MKGLSCFLALLLTVMSCGVVSFAVGESEGTPIPYTVNGSIDYDSVSLPGLSGNAPTYYYNFDNGKTSPLAYTKLDACQKKIYDAVVNAPAGTVKINVDFEYGEFLYSNFTGDYFDKVMYAICNDRPDIFYYNGYSGSGLTYDNDYVKSLEYFVEFYGSTSYTKYNIASYHSEMSDAMKAVPVDLTNRYNFVKSVHDYLCDTIIYPDLSSPEYTGNAHDAYGALVEKVAVCQGYAESFKVICDYYKIPCVTITGSADGVAHMWNAVQMDDGLWYLLDVTWDDKTENLSKTFYDFFLIGKNTYDVNFGKRKFSESHVVDSDLFLPVLKYANEKYAETDHFTEFGATFNSFARNEENYLIRSVFDANDTYIYYHGIYVDVNTPVTNTAFSVNSGEDGTIEDWTLVVIGDCNGDGVADSADYTDAVNKALTLDEPATPYDYAADADCDGTIDAIDISILERVINGNKTSIEIE